MKRKSGRGAAPARFRSRGAIMFVLTMVFFSIAILAVATDFFSRMEGRAATSANVDAGLQKLQDALVTYVAAHGYLPCPADGSLDTGNANPPGPTNYCFTPDGTVPWTDLNLSASDALDPWGRKISFRVYDGNVGLTDNQDHSTTDPPSLGYASMVPCDTTNTPYGDAQWFNVTTPACAAHHNHTAAQFLGGKPGLTIDDNLTVKTGIAFVLISHGPTGYGAWLPGVAQRATPPNPAGLENLNTQAGGTYYVRPTTDLTVSPTDVNHFDDRVVYLSILDLANKAGLGARDWPELAPPVPNFKAITTANMSGGGTGHFITQTTAGQNFQQVSGSNGTQVGTGIGTGIGIYSACLWWPQTFNLYAAGASGYRRALVVYVEAAFDSTDPGGGFTIGFLPADGYAAGAVTTAPYAPDNGSCGSGTDPTSIGWDNGVLSDGNLPTPRFAVEVDMAADAIRGDPANNHAAIDFNGVTHDGTLASHCSLSASTYDTTNGFNDCYTGPSTTRLRDGLGNFHRLRVEVEPNSASCGGTAPLLQFWLLPYGTCNPVAPATAPQDCTDMQNVAQQYAPASFPATGVYLSQCIPAPVPADAYNSVYFGLTTNNRSLSNTNFSVIFQNLNSGLVPLQ